MHSRNECVDLALWGRTRRVFGLLLICGAILAVSGCGRKSDVEEVVAEPEPLARVGDRVITESDFEFEIRRRQETGRPIINADTVLQEMIEREVMIQAARGSGVEQDPAVQRDLENQLLVKWLDQSLHAERDRVTVSEETLRQQYEERIEEFTRPGMNRLAILYRRVSPLDPDETVQELIDTLNEARDLYLHDPVAATQARRIPGFGTVAAEYSEHQGSRYRGGDIGWIQAEHANGTFPAELIEVGLSLEVGEVSEVLVLDDGLYVVMKIDHRPPQITPFEEAVTVLRRRVIREKQEAVTEQFMARLKPETSIEINAEQAARLEIPSVPAPVEPRLRPLEDAVTLPNAP